MAATGFAAGKGLLGASACCAIRCCCLAAGVAAGYLLLQVREGNHRGASPRPTGMGKDFALHQKENLDDLIAEAHKVEAPAGAGSAAATPLHRPKPHMDASPPSSVCTATPAICACDCHPRCAPPAPVRPSRTACERWSAFIASRWLTAEGKLAVRFDPHVCSLPDCRPRAEVAARRVCRPTRSTVAPAVTACRTGSCRADKLGEQLADDLRDRLTHAGRSASSR